jgi:hypothetical protein
MHAFSPKNPIFCTFLQGGGTTFWQGKNGGFSGPGGRASARAQDTFCVTFLVIQKDLQSRFSTVIKIYYEDGKIVCKARIVA